MTPAAPAAKAAAPIVKVVPVVPAKTPDMADMTAQQIAATLNMFKPSLIIAAAVLALLGYAFSVYMRRDEVGRASFFVLVAIAIGIIAR